MLARLRSFLTAWTRRERFEGGLDEEVRFHLDAHAEADRQRDDGQRHDVATFTLWPDSGSGENAAVSYERLETEPEAPEAAW